MNISVPGCCLIIGQQGSGKSYLLKYFIYKNRSILKYGIVFSHTAFNEGNLDYLPKKYIYSDYQPDKAYNLMKIQESLPKEKRHLAFIILDDCVYDKWTTCKYFKRMITQLRHYNILVIICAQYANKIPPDIRENCFQACLFNLSTKNSIEAAYESYGQKFESYTDFKNFLLENTKDRNFIFYNKLDNEKPYKISKAPPKIPRFRLKY